MKKILNKMIAHFLSQQGKSGTYWYPLQQAYRYWVRQERCILLGATSFIVALASLMIYVALEDKLDILGWVFIMSAVTFPMSAICGFVALVARTIITDKNPDADGLISAVKDFQKLLGGSPHRLGPTGAAKRMVRTAKKILRKENKGRDANVLRERLGQQYDIAKLLMPVPVGGLGPIFDRASGKTKYLATSSWKGE